MIKLPPPWALCDLSPKECLLLSHAQIVARDLEVVKIVLDAVGNVLSATYLAQEEGVYVELPQHNEWRECVNAIRNLEIKHD